MFQIKKKKWRPVNTERLDWLALPTIRPMPKLREAFEVKPRALIYKITKRMERLAVHKKPPRIPLRILGAVSPAAMKAIGRAYTHSSLRRTLQFPPPRSLGDSSLDTSSLIRAYRRLRFSTPILLHAIGLP